jgi:hypothetical protein
LPLSSIPPANLYATYSADDGVFDQHEENCRISYPSLFVPAAQFDKVHRLGPILGISKEESRNFVDFVFDFIKKHPKYITGCRPLVAIFEAIYCNKFDDSTSSGLLRIEPFMSLCLLWRSGHERKKNLSLGSLGLIFLQRKTLLSLVYKTYGSPPRPPPNQ